MELKNQEFIFNGNAAGITLPFFKQYKDGSKISVEDVGDYKLRIVKDGRDPFVSVIWDKGSTYSIQVSNIFI